MSLLPNKARNETKNTANKEITTTKNPDCWVKYMDEVIAPGPANRGVPIGTIASEIFVSICLERGKSPLRKSKERIKSKIPPAIIKAGIDTPRTFSKPRPPKEKTKRRTNAAKLISKAALACFFLLDFPKRIRKIGIVAKGSTIAKRAIVVLIISTTILSFAQPIINIS